LAASIIDGRAIAQEFIDSVKERSAKLPRKPGLAVVIVGDDPASKIYVSNKAKKAKEAGFHSAVFELPASTSYQKLLEQIEFLNNAPDIDGILVQLPLPSHINTKRIIEAISPAKDVDGFHPYNIGKLAQRDPTIIPCTPLGCLRLIYRTIGPVKGLHAVMVGASNIVGRPMGQLLLLEGCTVTQTHRFTPNTPELCRQADIVVAAAGKPELVKADWIKPGATVIDVGINRVGSRIVGDVAFDEVKEVAGAITPVPGGVGPMTIACLLENTLTQSVLNQPDRDTRRAVRVEDLEPEWIEALQNADYSHLPDYPRGPRKRS
jgi:methylenetetrahydrofolate dehydrogenase (NADP+)/methenyltetrahydrofolate cyclohydrolase